MTSDRKILATMMFLTFTCAQSVFPNTVNQKSQSENFEWLELKPEHYMVLAGVFAVGAAVLFGRPTPTGPCAYCLATVTFPKYILHEHGCERGHAFFVHLSCMLLA